MGVAIDREKPFCVVAEGIDRTNRLTDGIRFFIFHPVRVCGPSINWLGVEWFARTSLPLLLFFSLLRSVVVVSEC